MEKYIGMERFIFSDVYKLFLKYEGMGDTDREWGLLLKESNEISKKYNNCKLVRSIILGLIEHMEFRLRERDKYGSLNKEILSNMGFK